MSCIVTNRNIYSENFLENNNIRGLLFYGKGRAERSKGIVEKSFREKGRNSNVNISLSVKEFISARSCDSLPKRPPLRPLFLWRKRRRRRYCGNKRRKNAKASGRCQPARLWRKVPLTWSVGERNEIRGNLVPAFSLLENENVPGK